MATSRKLSTPWIQGTPGGYSLAYAVALAGALPPLVHLRSRALVASAQA